MQMIANVTNNLCRFSVSRSACCMNDKTRKLGVAAIVIAVLILAYQYLVHLDYVRQEIESDRQLVIHACNPQRWFLADNNNNNRNTAVGQDSTALEPLAAAAIHALRKNNTRLRPACMKKWLQSKSSHYDFQLAHAKVEQEILKMAPQLLSPSSAKAFATAHSGPPNCLTPLPTAVSFPQVMDANFLHIPHFCVAYFQFFSIALSAYTHFKTQYDACNQRFKHMIVDKVVSKELHVHGASKYKWVKDLATVIEDYWSANTIISDSCIPESKMLTSGRTRSRGSSFGGHSINNSSNFYRVLKWPAVPYSWAGWFFHPADAMLMGSMITDSDPCSLHGKAKAISRRENKVLIISRKYDRSVLNYQQVADFIEVNMNDHANSHRYSKFSVIPSKFDNSSVHFFEDKSMKEQVEIMRDASILITAHGAAETNIAFMQPCSVIIEVYPWGLYTDFFGTLTYQSDLIKYSWIESEEHTTFTKLYRRHPECVQTIKSVLESVDQSLRTSSTSKTLYEKCSTFIGSQTTVRLNATNVCSDMLKYDFQKDSNEYATSRDLVFTTVCSNDKRCRSCSRGADGVAISLDYLSSTLNKALSQRQACIRSHPFYNE